MEGPSVSCIPAARITMPSFEVHIIVGHALRDGSKSACQPNKRQTIRSFAESNLLKSVKNLVLRRRRSRSL